MDRFYDFVGVNFWDALFVLLNTLLIFFVAKKFLFGPVMKIIHDRQKEIDDLYDAAGSAKYVSDTMSGAQYLQLKQDAWARLQKYYEGLGK